MDKVNDPQTFFIVLTVLLFMFLGIAILIVMDHKARLPGGFKGNPFSIRGLHRDHPYVAFLTTIILFGIIASLVFELTVAVMSRFNLFAEEQLPQIVQELKEQRFTEKKRHFHNEPSVDKITLGKKNVCFECHGDFPHSKQRMVRSLLNMHTQFIGCMTCHADPDKIAADELQFQWLNYSGISVKGKPFGTDIDPHSGSLILTDDYYSKIVVYNKTVDAGNLLEITEDRSDVQEFIKIKDTLSDHDRDAMKKRFHKDIKSKGRFCPACHSDEKKAFLPYRQLGFSDKRVSELTNLNISGLVSKYEKFYIPNLFETNKNKQP